MSKTIRYREKTYARIGLFLQSTLGASLILSFIGFLDLRIAVLPFIIGVIMTAYPTWTFSNTITLLIKTTYIIGTLLTIIFFGLLYPLLNEYWRNFYLFGSLGILMLTASILSGKEAFCFKFISGWILMGLLYPATFIISFLGLGKNPYLWFVYSLQTIIGIKLAVDKWRKPIEYDLYVPEHLYPLVKKKLKEK